MNVPDAIRGTESHGNPPAADAKTPDAIRTGSSRDGVTVGPLSAVERPANTLPPNSSAKWIGAAVVLAVMVFGITFALNFVGSSGKPDVIEDKGPSERLNLTFATTKLPPEVEGGDPTKQHPPIDVEFKKEGWLDFWFENGNEKPIVVGLRDSSCTCSGAKIFLLPPGSKMSPGQEATLAKTATTSTMAKGSDEGVTIAPKQVGWIRLEWSGESRKDTISLTLWLNAISVGPYPILEAHLRVHDPLKVENYLLPFAAVDASKLPRTLTLMCWSVTRKEIDVSAAFVGRTEKEGVEPLVIEKVERLNEKECQELTERLNKENKDSKEPKVLAASRVLVTLRGQTEKGLIDAGPFRRRFEVVLAGYKGEPQVVEANGFILGEVQVLGSTSGHIDFTSFRGAVGSKSEPLTLQTSTPGLKLEVDKVRTSRFLEVTLKEPTDKSDLWQMTVRVKPGEASGSFPREKPDEYRDSAVYIRPVRPKDQPIVRSTRIPVRGSATD